MIRSLYSKRIIKIFLIVVDKKFKNNFLKTVYIHTGLPKFGSRQKIQFFRV